MVHSEMRKLNVVYFGGELQESKCRITLPFNSQVHESSKALIKSRTNLLQDDSGGLYLQNLLRRIIDSNAHTASRLSKYWICICWVIMHNLSVKLSNLIFYLDFSTGGHKRCTMAPFARTPWSSPTKTHHFSSSTKTHPA